MATAHLLQQQGYAATGLTQILEVSGAPKGSFYFYFPHGKDQLVAEALRLSGAQVEQTIRRMASEATSPGDLISRFASREAAILADSGFRDGCPIATVALEMASESESIREACRQIFEGWITALADGFEPYLGARARAAAERAFMLLEGGLLLSRVQRDIGPLLRASDALVDELAHLP